MSDDLDKCATCDNTRSWHEGARPLHPFNAGEAGATAFLEPRHRRGRPGAQDESQGRRISSPRPSMPMDPVLRQALVDKGILTPQDLRDAEEKIHAVTGMFNQAGPTMRGSHE